MADENRNEIEIADGRSGPRFTLDELFRGKIPEEWRALYRDAYDWGPDLGREIVEE